jgi:hypothetical protein
MPHGGGPVSLIARPSRDSHIGLIIRLFIAVGWGIVHCSGRHLCRWFSNSCNSGDDKTAVGFLRIDILSCPTLYHTSSPSSIISGLYGSVNEVPNIFFLPAVFPLWFLDSFFSVFLPYSISLNRLVLSHPIGLFPFNCSSNALLRVFFCWFFLHGQTIVLISFLTLFNKFWIQTSSLRI